MVFSGQWIFTMTEFVAARVVLGFAVQRYPFLTYAGENH
jgi:hypothetical protein